MKEESYFFLSNLDAFKFFGGAACFTGWTLWHSAALKWRAWTSVPYFPSTESRQCGVIRYDVSCGFSAVVLRHVEEIPSHS